MQDYPMEQWNPSTESRKITNATQEVLPTLIIHATGSYGQKEKILIFWEFPNQLSRSTAIRLKKKRKRRDQKATKSKSRIQS